jgi:predicted nucleic acid-binding protein
MSAPKNRPAFSRLLDWLYNHPLATIIPASDDGFHRAIELFDRRPDKSWSLTDCASFVTMTDHGLTEALTGDHHFEQAGFVALLK